MVQSYIIGYKNLPEIEFNETKDSKKDDDKALKDKKETRNTTSLSTKAGNFSKLSDSHKILKLSTGNSDENDQEQSQDGFTTCLCVYLVIFPTSD